MNDSIEQLAIYLRGIWEHRWAAMLLAWLVALGGWAWVVMIPDRFEASTRVYIDTDSALRPLLKGLAVESDIEQRLQLMTRTLLSRPNMEKLMRMTDLDIAVTTPAEQEKMVLTLKNAITVKNLSNGKKNRQKTSNFYAISYQNNDRELARQVVQSLLSILVEKSLGDTRKDSTVARDFIEQQIKEYEVKLSSAEDRLAEFKRNNMGYLPNQEGSYFGSLKGMQERLQNTKLELRESENRRDTLMQQIEEVTQNNLLASESEQKPQTPTQNRIHTLQSQLDVLLLQFTEHHPDVKELRAQLKALKKQDQEEAAVASKNPKSLLENNSMYQELRLALGKEETSIGAMEVRIKEYQSRIDNLEKKLDTLQQVEVELSRLDRDYALNKKNYEKLISRRDSAKFAGQAEQTGDSIQFRVIDPPWVPQKATEPNRLMLDSVVLLVAMAAGLGIAFLLSQNNPTFYSRKLLQDVTGVAVFGSVTRVYSEKELVRRRVQHGAYVITGILLLVVFSGFLTIEFMELKVLDNLRQTVGQWI